MAQIACGSYVAPQWHEAAAFRRPADLQVVCQRGIAFLDLPHTVVWFDDAGQHSELLDHDRPVGEQSLLHFHRQVSSLVLKTASLEDAFQALDDRQQGAGKLSRKGRRLNVGRERVRLRRHAGSLTRQIAPIKIARSAQFLAGLLTAICPPLPGTRSSHSMPTTAQDLDLTAINTIRTLAMDAVRGGQQRPSRHADGAGAGGVPAVDEASALRSRRSRTGRTAIGSSSPAAMRRCCSIR